MDRQRREHTGSAARRGGAQGRGQALAAGAGDQKVGGGGARGAADSTRMRAGLDVDAVQGGACGVGDVGGDGERAAQAAADIGQGSGPNEADSEEAGARMVAYAGAEDPGGGRRVHAGCRADEMQAGGDGVGSLDQVS